MNVGVRRRDRSGDDSRAAGIPRDGSGRRVGGVPARDPADALAPGSARATTCARPPDRRRVRFTRSVTARSKLPVGATPESPSGLLATAAVASRPASVSWAVRSSSPTS
ncbi:hypothetical protein NGM10_04050 [Halorussus salilacus]|nr:hypothetical protein [Halorussus salilacus]USZ68913.1 hypothetical protein NGM10_04050 [Halorussus salilacus]